MNADARGNGRPAGRPVRTDGGSPMPGVPSEDEQEGEESQQSSSGTGASSDSQMPGVPEPKGSEPAVESGGGSCEAAAHEEAEEDATHDLTTAFTLAALTQLENPARVVAEARSWSDWVGVVGEADAPTLNTFLRRQNVDIDFFNGVATPGERLARVASAGSAFHSDRLVLVGSEGQEEIATEADWEFEGIVSTAEEAGWTLR